METDTEEMRLDNGDSTTLDAAALRSVIQVLPYPLLFVTVSGAHLYGFSSPDSDVDLRGAYVLPLRGVLGLDAWEDTFARQFEHDGHEIDLVAHDIKKLLELLLKKNGNVLEQVYSPLVVKGGAVFEELRTLMRGAITRHVYHHYAGFARTKIESFEGESPHRVKTVLYAFRVLLTGIWLLRTGEVEANLFRLNDSFRLPFIPDLIAQKVKERAILDDADLPTYRQAIARLQQQLETAYVETTLPDAPTNRHVLNDFLVRVRLEYGLD